MAGRRERTTERILDGAARAFAKGGFAGTSMEEIAAAAGVSKLLLYRDFAGKHELYQAVLERTWRRLSERVPIEPSNASLRVMVSSARDDPDGFVLLFGRAPHEPGFAGYVAGINDGFIRGAEEMLRPIEPDPVLRRWLAEVVTYTTNQAIITWLEHGDPERDDEMYERLLAANRGMANRRPGGGPRDAAGPDPGSTAPRDPGEQATDGRGRTP